jgi:cell division protein FtsI/penicillin-binding protein 2
VHSFGRAGVIRDAHPEQGDGWLTFEQAFARSSNICFAKLARELESTSSRRAAQLRIGSRSGVDPPAEPNGWLALPATGPPHALCLGYGEIRTALQLANLYITISCGSLRPRMALGIERANGGRSVPAAVRRVSADLAATLRALCAGRAEGTGARRSRRRVAGKTRTARKPRTGVTSHAMSPVSAASCRPNRLGSWAWWCSTNHADTIIVVVTPPRRRSGASWNR